MKCQEEMEQGLWVKDQAQGEEWDSAARAAAEAEGALEPALAGSASVPNAGTLFPTSRACHALNYNAPPAARRWCERGNG